MFGKDDIVEAMKSLEYEVQVTEIALEYKDDDERLRPILTSYLEKKEFDIVFTTNFFPIISDVCNALHLKYVSWVYDSPQIALYKKAIQNPCNYVFTFDSEECMRLRGKGVEHVYYMPLAVNPKRLNQIKISQQERDLFSADVSMVASLYNEEHNLYDRMAPKLTDYTRGYLEGAMQVQKNLFGGFMLEDILYNNKIMDDMYKAMPYDVDEGSLTNKEYVYANYFLARKVATIQRMEYIGVVSQKFDMKVYTPGDLSEIPTAKNMGTVDYMTDMNKVFRLSKINLNITLPSIHTGIPLRAMDIMGAGGFLLTNYQTDFFGLFEPDVDYVYYTSLLDAVNKIEYYLEHEDERKAIAEHGKKTMEQFFTYQNQLKQIFEIVEEKSDV